MLHLTNGDAAGDPLRHSGLPGEVIVWFDVLHEGPVPCIHGAAWREVRARYLSGAGYAPFDDVRRTLQEQDDGLSRCGDHDELVLWFEHDLFDQLLLARHLHWLGTQPPARTRLSLVCIDRFPGVEPFHGLGQLSSSQLASLFPQRQPVTPDVLRAGADVWRAFTDADPRATQAVVTYGAAGLPFISGALERHLEEFPGAGDGLSRTERAVLQALDVAPQSLDVLFAAVSAREERVFMADLAFWRIVRDMAAPPAPLVTIAIEAERAGRLPEATVTRTAAGARVVAGAADAVRLRGIDRWLGGVHLEGPAVWRWDPSARRLIPPT